MLRAWIGCCSRGDTLGQHVDNSNRPYLTVAPLAIHLRAPSESLSPRLLYTIPALRCQQLAADEATSAPAHGRG